jgi:hypothetical protein
VRQLNSVWGGALLTALGYGAFAVTRWLWLGRDISRFVIAGVPFILPAAGATVGLSVSPNAAGYDGQFYYLLALNPFSPHSALLGQGYDIPAYRAQRILYPLLVWTLSLGGRPALIPWLLVLVNLAAITAIGALAAALAKRLGLAPLWGLSLALYPGLLIGLASDLGDPLALACALGGVLCISERRWIWAALLLSLAALARETTVALAGALLLAALLARFTPRLRLFPRTDWRGGALAGAIPLVVELGWQAILAWRWGSAGILAAGADNVGIPLLGLFAGLIFWTTLRQPAIWAPTFGVAAYLLGMVELARRCLGRFAKREGWGYLTLAWGLYLALTLTLSFNVWDFFWNFLRGAAELGILSGLIMLTAGLRVRQIALSASLALWLVCFLTIAPIAQPTL